MQRHPIVSLRSAETHPNTVFFFFFCSLFSFLHFHFPLSLLSPFIKVYFYLSARG